LSRTRGQIGSDRRDSTGTKLCGRRPASPANRLAAFWLYEKKLRDNPTSTLVRALRAVSSNSPSWYTHLLVRLAGSMSAD
jgi:hypothetical protein